MSTQETPGRDLDVRFASGVAWTAGAKWVTQGLTWLSIYVTARLLSPADFGISEMGAMFITITSVVAEFGISGAVLQMQELKPKAIAQLHTFSCLIGGGVFTASLLAVPLIAAFFRIEHLKLLIAANNVGFLIIGVQAVPFALLSKDLDYRRLSISEGAQIAAQSLLTMGAAWLGWGYWSMTAGVAGGRFVRTALLLYWKPVPFTWPQWESIREAVHMGGKMSLGRLAWSTYISVDGVVVGRVLGDSVLGVYRMALNLVSSPAEKISMLLMRSSTPLFVKVQHDHVEVRRYLVTMVELLTLGLMPVMFGLAIVAPEAIRVTIGDKWLPAVLPLRWLAAFTIMRVLGVLYEQVLMSQRLVDFGMWMSIFCLCILPPAFWVAAQWGGAQAVAATWLLMVPLTTLPSVIRVHRHIQLSYWSIGHASWASVAGTAVMMLVLFALRPWLGSLGLPLWVALVLEVCAGGLVYAAMLFGCFRSRVMRYWHFVKRIRSSRGEPAAA